MTPQIIILLFSLQTEIGGGRRDPRTLSPGQKRFAPVKASSTLLEFLPIWGPWPRAKREADAKDASTPWI